MNAVALRRCNALTPAQVSALLQQLRERTGNTVESPAWLLAEHVDQRIRLLGLRNPEEYLEALDNSIAARAEWLALVDLLTVKETRFFRQPEAFACVARHLGELLERGSLGPEFSIWSAGCASGEELYSLGMIAEYELRRCGVDVEWHGIGTDVSFGAVSTARHAHYPENAVRNIPLNYRHAFVEAAGNDSYAVAQRVRARTNFFHSNLLHIASAPFADFDIVYCQNVLIYFDRDTRHHIIDQLVARTRTGGLLVLGAGEDVCWQHPAMTRVQHSGVTAYLKVEV